MTRLLALSLLLFACTVRSVAADDGLPRPDVKSFMLKNGMQVVLIEDHRAPVVTQMLWYKVGAADEPVGKAGIAHLLEHLMFKGTEKVASGEFSKIVARNGGTDNAFTSQDYTGYFQRIASDRLPLIMEMEADRMRNLTLTEEDVLPERDVVLEERNSRYENDPGAMLSEQMSAALFVNHPYGKSIIGWKHEIAALTYQDALDFYEQHYAPNNAILVIAGDVTKEELKLLAEKTYGQVRPNPAIRERVRVKEPPAVAARTVTMEDARVKKESWNRMYLVPSARLARPGEAEALSILSTVIGGTTSSPLYQKLVVEEKIAVSAGAWYGEDARDMSRFGFYASPAEGVELDQLNAAVLNVLHDVVEEGISAKQVEDAVNQELANLVYAQDSQYRMARHFGAQLTAGQTLEQIVAWPDRLAAVTPDQVTEALKALLESKGHVTGFLRMADAPEEKRS